MNALNLPAFVILDTQQDDHDLHFFQEMVTQPPICPCCGTVNGDLVGYGRDMQIFMDTPDVRQTRRAAHQPPAHEKP